MIKASLLQNLNLQNQIYLVVDDMELMRKVTANQLRALGCEKIHTAADGAAALDVLRKQRVDVVLSDLRMPVMDGLELLLAMRADPHLAQLPFMMITAETERHRIESVISAGANSLMLKPFNPGTLKQRLERILSSQSPSISSSRTGPATRQTSPGGGDALGADLAKPWTSILVARAAQPRLTSLQRAIGRDIDRIKSAAVSDTPGLLVKLDELVHLVDELVLVNAVVPANGMGLGKRPGTESAPTWWQRSLQVVFDEARGLVRVSRIAQPEAALLSPEQSFFLRENFKLKLLNARLGLLARQLESSRADLADAALLLNKYFDVNSRKTQTTAALLQQVQAQMKTLQLPRVDETLAALTTAAAGR